MDIYFLKGSSIMRKIFALSTLKKDEFIREDIGRHNAVDKVIGYAVREGLNPEGLILLTSGRISYEMLSKAAKYGFAVIGSRTAATKQAVELANFLHIELVGYLRGKMAVKYTSQERVMNDLHNNEYPNIRIIY